MKDEERSDDNMELWPIVRVKDGMKLFATCIVFLICCRSLFAADKVGVFSDLQAGEEMKVDFNSTGCFHQQTYKLSFRRQSEVVVSATTFEFVRSEDSSVITATNETALGQVTLSGTDLTGLDKLLRFYRSGRSGGCTTSDRIIVCRLRDGKIVATEHFKDDSCATYEMKELLTMPSLISRIQKSK
jgi:hypothetical protein